MRDTYLLLLVLLALLGTAACNPTTALDFQPAAQVAEVFTPTASPPATLTVAPTLTATPIPSPTLDPVSATATAEMAPYLTPISLTPTPWVVPTANPISCADITESHPDDCQVLYDLYIGTGGLNWHTPPPCFLVLELSVMKTAVSSA
ncbi:MAG: hypothetical protein OT477_10155 [Chloroflexi bacterium]|nr:hypothetical protein [Chloroflexota bacterium]